VLWPSGMSGMDTRGPTTSGACISVLKMPERGTPDWRRVAGPLGSGLGRLPPNSLSTLQSRSCGVVSPVVPSMYMLYVGPAWPGGTGKRWAGRRGRPPLGAGWITMRTSLGSTGAAVTPRATRPGGTLLTGPLVMPLGGVSCCRCDARSDRRLWTYRLASHSATISAKSPKMAPSAIPAIWSELRRESVKGRAGGVGVGVTMVGVAEESVPIVPLPVAVPSVVSVVGAEVRGVVEPGTPDDDERMGEVGLPDDEVVGGSGVAVVPLPEDGTEEGGCDEIGVVPVGGFGFVVVAGGGEDVVVPPAGPVPGRNIVVVVNTVVAAFGATVTVAKTVSNRVLVTTPTVIVVVTSIVTVDVIVDRTTASASAPRTTLTPRPDSCASSGS